MERVVPFTVEFVSADIKHSHLGVAHFDPLRIRVVIDFSSYGEPASCGRRGDQIHDSLEAGKRCASPVHTDETEQAVLNLVPFAGTRREMGDGDRNPDLIAEVLELCFPEPDPAAVAAASIGGDDQCGSL